MVTADAAQGIAATLQPRGRGSVALRAELMWVLATAALGFAVSALTVSWLELPRSWVVLLLAAAVGLLWTAYVRTHRIDLLAIVRHHWVWATARGVAFGVVIVALVLPSDPSAREGGARLAFDVVWLGVVYGMFDALLLNVLPMMAIWSALTHLGWIGTWRGRIWGTAATLGANLLVTTSYHAGYPEFRGPEIVGPIGGNLLIGIGYVLVPNPLTAVVAHIILHVASVLTGVEGPVQLPPHY